MADIKKKVVKLCLDFGCLIVRESFLRYFLVFNHFYLCFVCEWRFKSFLLIHNTVGVPILALHFSGKPFKRGFYCDDTSIRYPFKDSTISTLLLYFYGTGIPVVTIITVEFIRFSRGVGGTSRVCPSRNPTGQRNWSNIIEFGWIAYNELVVFVFGALASQFLTDIAKYSIGRLRPHFIDVCRPIGLDTILCPASSANYRYIEEYNCMIDSGYKIKDARLSFMSGHSSFAAYTMIFTAVCPSFYALKYS
jgi:phosphatidate phosphatase